MKGRGGRRSDSDEEPEADVWALCDACQKWRRLPPGTQVDDDAPWYCSLNPDKARNRCEAAEEVWQDPQPSTSGRDEEDEPRVKTGRRTKSLREDVLARTVGTPAWHGSGSKRKVPADPRPAGLKAPPAPARLFASLPDELQELCKACRQILVGAGMWQPTQPHQLATSEHLQLPNWLWHGLQHFVPEAAQVARHAVEAFTAAEYFGSGNFPVASAPPPGPSRQLPPQVELFVRLTLLTAASLALPLIEQRYAAELASLQASAGSVDHSKAQQQSIRLRAPPATSSAPLSWQQPPVSAMLMGQQASQPPLPGLGARPLSAAPSPRPPPAPPCGTPPVPGWLGNALLPPVLKLGPALGGAQAHEASRQQLVNVSALMELAKQAAAGSVYLGDTTLAGPGQSLAPLMSHAQLQHHLNALNQQYQQPSSHVLPIKQPPPPPPPPPRCYAVPGIAPGMSDWPMASASNSNTPLARPSSTPSLLQDVALLQQLDKQQKGWHSPAAPALYLANSQTGSGGVTGSGGSFDGPPSLPGLATSSLRYPTLPPATSRPNGTNSQPLHAAQNLLLNDRCGSVQDTPPVSSFSAGQATLNLGQDDGTMNNGRMSPLLHYQQRDSQAAGGSGASGNHAWSQNPLSLTGNTMAGTDTEPLLDLGRAAP